MASSVSDFIEHYGTKGMRWGVRRSRKERKEASDFKTTKHLRSRKTHELSNKQLKKVNERINLESSYSRLNPTKIKKGQMVAKGVLAGATTAASVYTLFNSPAGKALMNAGRKTAYKQLKFKGM
jgi:hypothetical protein